MDMTGILYYQDILLLYFDMQNTNIVNYKFYNQKYLLCEIYHLGATYYAINTFRVSYLWRDELMKYLGYFCSLPFLLLITKLQAIIYKLHLGKFVALIIGIPSILLLMLQLFGFCMNNIPILTLEVITKDTNESYKDYAIRLWNLVMAPAWLPENASWLLKRVVVIALFIFRAYFFCELWQGNILVDISGLYI